MLWAGARQMNRSDFLLAPVALMLGFGGVDLANAGVLTISDLQLPEALRASVAQQVRIEQHMSIRISPGPALPPPELLIQLQQDASPPQLTERKIGKCLPVAGLSAVRVSDKRLLLFMRDQRVIGASLEKSCRAADFYSGFYVERSVDGQICVDRDRLQSRSGAKCKLLNLKQLVGPRDK